MTIEDTEYQCIGVCRIGPDGCCLGCGRPTDDVPVISGTTRHDADAMAPTQFPPPSGSG